MDAEDLLAAYFARQPQTPSHLQQPLFGKPQGLPSTTKSQPVGSTPTPMAQEEVRALQQGGNQACQLYVSPRAKQAMGKAAAHLMQGFQPAFKPSDDSQSSQSQLSHSGLGFIADPELSSSLQEAGLGDVRFRLLTPLEAQDQMRSLLLKQSRLQTAITKMQNTIDHLEDQVQQLKDDRPNSKKNLERIIEATIKACEQYICVCDQSASQSQDN